MQFKELKFERVVYGPGKAESFSIFHARVGADAGKSCETKII